MATSPTAVVDMVVVAVEGCGHGELDNIYAALATAEEEQNTKVDLLLICGDFQAVRNAADLAGMACPPKYRAMNTFYKYYAGEKLAPVLTIFVGGNHEASAHLCELHYGGWVAPNIYYLGFAGVVNFGGLRIGGQSGIYNQRHFHQGHHERPPFSEDEMRSIYHIRELEVLQLMQLRRPLDIFLSHDWPQHIAKHGDTAALLRQKSFLRGEIADGSLGSPPAMAVLQAIRPSYWFSAHLHVKFAAAVHHPQGGVTRFLSLDKCLPNRKFMQLLELPGDGSLGPHTLSYDPEWIAVLRSTAHLHSAVRARLPLTREAVAAASGGRSDFAPTDAEIDAVHALGGPTLPVPLTFAITARPYIAGEPITAAQEPFTESPQTAAFVHTFGLPKGFRTQRGATLQTPGVGGAGRATGGSSDGTFSGRATMQLPPPVGASDSAVPNLCTLLPQPFNPTSQPFNPTSYGTQTQVGQLGGDSGADVGRTGVGSSSAQLRGLLDAVHVAPLDEEIDLDDD